ncbi:hypothetical protein TTRE_0000638901 [Trichuris trichiura]|uniref:Integrase zinc-binding domain-containing protein n=1 Tax=Trichuris trichiura TaxID=36087 RepID=A0A077ZCI4_TRITR|nr:hypothetical protein TTRE_0000638901 [Trichuris trichiura]
MATAEKIWLRRVQRETFEEDYQRLKRNGTLTSLDAFLDEDGIIRVGGRLQSTDLPEKTKQPIVLPSKYTVVDLLIRRAHERQLHAGVEQTLATTMQQFWILHSRSSLKRVLRSCIICKRQNAPSFQQKIGSLPPERVSAKHVYEHLASRRIIWKFITEQSPWDGGAWERLVRSVKTALKKTLHRSLLNADETMTMLCEVESQINARHLTFEKIRGTRNPITPFHFLRGRPPEVNTTVEKDDLGTSAFAAELTKRWQHYRVVLSQLWNRWKKEYVVKAETHGLEKDNPLLLAIFYL